MLAPRNVADSLMLDRRQQNRNGSNNRCGAPNVFELKAIQRTRGTSLFPQKPFPIAKRPLESSASTKVSRIWNLARSFFRQLSVNEGP